MPLPPIDLDDRTWADLVDEARASIPALAAGWTDHNVHDPGITLVELLAWLVEQDLYRVNRVPERHRRTFLRLAGFAPAPPRPARVVLEHAVAPGQAPVRLAAGTPVSSGGVPFRTLTSVAVSDAALRAVQVHDGARFEDATAAWAAGRPFGALGPDPAAGPPDGPALYLGFDPPPAGPLTLWIEVAEPAAGVWPDRAHHGACCRWECWDGAAWTPCPTRDRTRCLTLSGGVELAPAATAATVLGTVAAPQHWIRCRLARGRPDVAPAIGAVAVHAAPATQVARVRRTFRIAPGTVTAATETPVPGTVARLRLAFDQHDRLTTLAAVDDPSLPRAAVFAYQPATAGAEGTLTAGLVLLGRGSGDPEQMLQLPDAPVAHGRARVWALPAGGPARRVRLVADVGASGPLDDDAVLDGQTGRLRFGDGLHGRAVPAGAPVVAAYDATLAARGNVAAGGAWAGPLPARNPLPARGGRDAEDLGPAVLRASSALWAHERLLELPAAGSATLDGLPRELVLARPAPARIVTLADAERLALATPGTHVRRVRAWAGIDGRHLGLAAAGVLTLVVLPALPAARPVPTAGLLAAVGRFADGHRALGSRVRVVGPAYVEVRLRVRATAAARVAPAEVRAAVEARLRTFLHPLRGGRTGRGWPFGRDIARSELLAVVEGAAGIDHVDALVLHGCGRDRCDVLPLPPTGLPDLVALDAEVTA